MRKVSFCFGCVYSRFLCGFLLMRRLTFVLTARLCIRTFRGQELAFLLAVVDKFSVFFFLQSSLSCWFRPPGCLPRAPFLIAAIFFMHCRGVYAVCRSFAVPEKFALLAFNSACLILCHAIHPSFPRSRSSQICQCVAEWTSGLVC